MASVYSASKEGFVQDYRIEGTVAPGSDTYYFEVTITDDPKGRNDPEKWGMPRNRLSGVIDINAGEERYAISYSNTHQAIIATVKDALHNGNKVLFEGIRLGPEPEEDPVFEQPAAAVVEVATVEAGELPDPAAPEPGFPGLEIEPGLNVFDPAEPRDDLPTFELRQVTIYR